MKNYVRKKKGFTLVETVISFCIISIVSVGVYSAYILMIKDTKLAEEKQSVSLIGKRTIEDINGAIDANKIIQSGSEIVIKDLNLLKNEDLSKNIDSLVMSGDKESFSKVLHLDNNYNVCKETDTNYVYEEELVIEKVKAILGNSTGTGESGLGESKDIDFNLNKDNIDEDEDSINNSIKIIENNFSISKEEGENNNPEINGTAFSDDDDAFTLNVYIDKAGDNKVQVEIKDKTGKTLIEPAAEAIDDNNINHLNLHFNFKGYRKEDKETLKDLKINVYNKISEAESNKIVSNIYIEKSVDLKVDVKAYKGEINIFNRDDNKKISKIGPLYNIKVRIAPKGKLNEDDSQILFAGYTNKNIDIKKDV